MTPIGLAKPSRPISGISIDCHLLSLDDTSQRPALRKVAKTQMVGGAETGLGKEAEETVSGGRR